MTDIALQAETKAFFDDFVTAFARFDGALIAERYVAPYLAMHAEGENGVFVEHREIGRYFQRVVEAYHDQGCRACRYFDLEVVAMGTQALLATVTWELLTQDGSVITAWRESYNLVRTRAGLRIFASTDHA